MIATLRIFCLTALLGLSIQAAFGQFYTGKQATPRNQKKDCPPTFVPRMWQDAHDMRRFNLGFCMGLNVALTKLQVSNLQYNNPSLEGVRYIDVNPTPGFFIGLITNLKLANHFDLRFIPAVQLQQRNINYQLRDSVYHRKLETSYLDLPLLIKFKSDYIDFHRVYVMFGPKLSFNLASDIKVQNNPDLLKVGVMDFSLDFAFGVDLYGDRVKLAPEIRYSLGFPNIYNPKNTRYGSTITQLTTHTITFCFNFE